MQHAKVHCNRIKDTLMATFEQEILKEIIGEELYHEVLMKIGGMQLSVPKPKKETVLFLYKKDYNMKQILRMTHLSERYVRRILKDKK